MLARTIRCARQLAAHRTSFARGLPGAATLELTVDADCTLLTRIARP